MADGGSFSGGRRRRLSLGIGCFVMRQDYVDAISVAVMIACLAVLAFYVYRLFYHPVICVRHLSDGERALIRERQALRRLKDEFLRAEASSGDVR